MKEKEWMALWIGERHEDKEVGRKGLTIESANNKGTSLIEA